MKNELKEQFTITPGTIFLFFLLVLLLLVPAIAMLIAFEKITTSPLHHQEAVLKDTGKPSQAVENALRITTEKAADRILPIPKTLGEDASVVLVSSTTGFHSMLEDVHKMLESQHIMFIENVEESSARIVIASHLDHQQTRVLKEELSVLQEKATGTKKGPDNLAITRLNNQEQVTNDPIGSGLFTISIHPQND